MDTNKELEKFKNTFNDVLDIILVSLTPIYNWALDIKYPDINKLIYYLSESLKIYHINLIYPERQSKLDPKSSSAYTITSYFQTNDSNLDGTVYRCECIGYKDFFGNIHACKIAVYKVNNN